MNLDSTKSWGLNISNLSTLDSNADIFSLSSSRENQTLKREFSHGLTLMKSISWPDNKFICCYEAVSPQLDEGS